MYNEEEKIKAMKLIMFLILWSWLHLLCALVAGVIAVLYAMVGNDTFMTWGMAVMFAINLYWFYEWRTYAGKLKEEIGLREEEDNNV